MMDKQDIKNHILLTLSTLRERPRVIYCGQDDYYSCRQFIEGYFWGLEYAFNIDLSKKISDWFAQKYKIESTATPYCMYPEYFHKEEPDSKKKEILLVLLEEYVNTQM